MKVNLSNISLLEGQHQQRNHFEMGIIDRGLGADLLSGVLEILDIGGDLLMALLPGSHRQHCGTRTPG